MLLVLGREEDQRKRRVMMTSTEVLIEYKKFISNVAKRVKGDTKIRTLDLVDLTQEGTMFLLDIWRRTGLTEEERIKLFTSSLEGHLRNIVKLRYNRDNRCIFVSPLYNSEKGTMSMLDQIRPGDPVDEVEISEVIDLIWKRLNNSEKDFLTELLALRGRKAPLEYPHRTWWGNLAGRLGLTYPQMQYRRTVFMEKVTRILEKNGIEVGKR